VGGTKLSVPSAPMPKELLAAARGVGDHGDSPVRFELAGATVIVVAGSEGDPREWWMAIWRIAGPGTRGSGGRGPAAGRTRVEALPAGLSAVAIRRSTAEPAVFVSDALEPDRRQAAVLAALSAAGAGHEAADQAGQVRRPRRRALAAVATAAAVVLVAACVATGLTLARHHRGQAAGLSPSGFGVVHAQGPDVSGPHSGTRGGREPSTGDPVPSASGTQTRGHSGKPTSHPSPRPSASRGPSPSPSPSTSSVSSPKPQPTSTSSAPTATPDPSATPGPTPTPTPSGSSGCIIVLGIHVCV